MFEFQKRIPAQRACVGMRFLFWADALELAGTKSLSVLAPAALRRDLAETSDGNRFPESAANSDQPMDRQFWADGAPVIGRAFSGEVAIFPSIGYNKKSALPVKRGGEEEKEKWS